MKKENVGVDIYIYENLGNLSNDIRLIRGAKGIDHLAENKRHDWLREAVSNSADGADGHQYIIGAISECE